MMYDFGKNFLLPVPLLDVSYILSFLWFHSAWYMKTVFIYLELKSYVKWFIRFETIYQLSTTTLKSSHQIGWGKTSNRPQTTMLIEVIREMTFTRHPNINRWIYNASSYFRYYLAFPHSVTNGEKSFERFVYFFLWTVTFMVVCSLTVKLYFVRKTFLTYGAIGSM